MLFPDRQEFCNHSANIQNGNMVMNEFKHSPASCKGENKNFGPKILLHSGGSNARKSDRLPSILSNIFFNRAEVII